MLLAVAAVASPWSSSAAQEEPGKPLVDQLFATIEGDRVEVSYRVVDAFDEETLEKIRSGIPVTFKHRIEVLGQRPFALAPRKNLGRAVVETRVSYDALTRRYSLTRVYELRGPHKKQAPPPVEESSVTESDAEMRAWMTRLDGVEVYDPAGPLADDTLKVRVESTLGRHYVMWIFPARLSVTAQLKLER
jgi:hypothetical protein